MNTRPKTCIRTNIAIRCQTVGDTRVSQGITPRATASLAGNLSSSANSSVAGHRLGITRHSLPRRSRGSAANSTPSGHKRLAYLGGHKRVMLAPCGSLFKTRAVSRGVRDWLAAGSPFLESAPPFFLRVWMRLLPFMGTARLTDPSAFRAGSPSQGLRPSVLFSSHRV